ncbi:hypothetical protein MMC12_006747 [Toensbergia leucococca]|nr:hypothetical protein [Toensbergia leucococca]
MTTTHRNLDNPDLAATYSETNKAYQGKYGLLLAQATGIKPGMKVVDLGSGTGDLILHVADLVGKNGWAMGIEPMSDRVALSNEKASTKPDLNAKFYEGSSDNLTELVKEKVDVVLMNSVFYWVNVAKRPEAIKSFFSILRDGGRIGICGGYGGYPNPLDFKRDALSEEPFASYPLDGYPELLTEAELNGYLTAAGFKDIKHNIYPDIVQHDNKEEYIKWLNASTFGNLLHVNYLP